MKMAVISAIIQLFSIAISIGETLGQGFQAWQEGGPEVGQTVHSASRAVLHHTSHFQQQLDDAVRTTFHETSADDVNRSGDNKGRHSTVGRRQDDCKNSDIAECVGLLEVLTNNDLGFAASVDELNRMCPVLLNGLQCIDNYTRRCLTPKHREYFNKLYAGTIRVIKDLCNTKGKYQEEYIRHAPCMRQVNPKYNQCSEAYHKKTANLNQINDAVVQLTEEEKNRNVITLCCSFQEYLQCSERVVYETCGNETALFTKAFLDRMAGPIVQSTCQAFSFSLHSCLQESSTDAPGNFDEAPTSVIDVSTQITQGSSHSQLLKNDTLENLVEDLILHTADRETSQPSTQLLESQRPLLEQSGHATTWHPYKTFTSRPHSLADPDPASLIPPVITFMHRTTIKPTTSLPATPVLPKGSDGGSVGINSLWGTQASEELAKADMQYTEDGTDEDPKFYASLTVQSPTVLSQVTQSMLHILKTRELHGQEEPNSYAELDDISFLPVFPDSTERRREHDHSESPTHSDMNLNASSGQVELSKSLLKLHNSSSSSLPKEHTDSSVLTTVSKVAKSLFPFEDLDLNSHSPLTNISVNSTSALTFRPRLLSHLLRHNQGVNFPFMSKVLKNDATNVHGNATTRHSSHDSGIIMATSRRDVHTRGNTDPSQFISSTGYKLPLLSRGRTRIRHRRKHLRPRSSQRRSRRPHLVAQERFTRKRSHRNVTVILTGKEGKSIKGRISHKPRRPIKLSEGHKSEIPLTDTQEVHLQKQDREVIGFTKKNQSVTTASPPLGTLGHEVIEKPFIDNSRMKKSESRLLRTSINGKARTAGRVGVIRHQSHSPNGTNRIRRVGNRNSPGNPPRRPWRRRKLRRNRRPFQRGRNGNTKNLRRRLRQKHQQVFSSGVDHLGVLVTSKPPMVATRTTPTITNSHHISTSNPLPSGNGPSSLPSGNVPKLSIGNGAPDLPNSNGASNPSSSNGTPGLSPLQTDKDVDRSKGIEGQNPSGVNKESKSETVGTVAADRTSTMIYEQWKNNSTWQDNWKDREDKHLVTSPLPMTTPVVSYTEGLWISVTPTQAIHVPSSSVLLSPTDDLHNWQKSVVLQHAKKERTNSLIFFDNVSREKAPDMVESSNLFEFNDKTLETSSKLQPTPTTSSNTLTQQITKNQPLKGATTFEEVRETHSTVHDEHYPSRTQINIESTEQGGNEHILSSTANSMDHSSDDFLGILTLPTTSQITEESIDTENRSGEKNNSHTLTYRAENGTLVTEKSNTSQMRKSNNGTMYTGNDDYDYQYSIPKTDDFQGSYESGNGQRFISEMQRTTHNHHNVSLAQISTYDESSIPETTYDFNDYGAEDTTHAYDTHGTRFVDHTAYPDQTAMYDEPSIPAATYKYDGLSAGGTTHANNTSRTEKLINKYDTSMTHGHTEAVSSTKMFNNGDFMTSGKMHEYGTIPESDVNVKKEDEYHYDRNNYHHENDPHLHTSDMNTSNYEISRDDAGIFRNHFNKSDTDNSMDWKEILESSTSRVGLRVGEGNSITSGDGRTLMSTTLPDDKMLVSPTLPDGKMLIPPTLPQELFHTWFRSRLQEEVREAVFPAPTPVPYVIRVRKEQEAAHGVVANFTPVVLDILESDFVPLVNPTPTNLNFQNGDMSTELENDMFLDQYLNLNTKKRENTKDSNSHSTNADDGKMSHEEQQIITTFNKTHSEEQTDNLNSLKHIKPNITVSEQVEHLRNSGLHMDLHFNKPTGATTFVIPKGDEWPSIPIIPRLYSSFGSTHEGVIKTSPYQGSAETSQEVVSSSSEGKYDAPVGTQNIWPLDYIGGMKLPGRKNSESKDFSNTHTEIGISVMETVDTAVTTNSTNISQNVDIAAVFSPTMTPSPVTISNTWVSQLSDMDDSSEETDYDKPGTVSNLLNSSTISEQHQSQEDREPKQHQPQVDREPEQHQHLVDRELEQHQFQGDGEPEQHHSQVDGGPEQHHSQVDGRSGQHQPQVDRESEKLLPQVDKELEQRQPLVEREYSFNTLEMVDKSTVANVEQNFSSVKVKNEAPTKPQHGMKDNTVVNYSSSTASGLPYSVHGTIILSVILVWMIL